MNTTHKVPSLDNQQFDLFVGAPSEVKSESRLYTAQQSGRCFISSKPQEMYVGTIRLQEYLQASGESTAFIVGQLLDGQDWQSFEQRYAATGRAPYSPRGMMGLILYGIMQGIHSLRSLERLARLNLGCMWVANGVTPDHANIGRFIVLHEASLTVDLFEALTRSVLQVTGSQSQRIAGDGTVIEAACSNYKLLKEEAVKAQTNAAHKACQQQPTNLKVQQVLEHAQQCEKIFYERKAERKKSGKQTETLCISHVEPQATLHRLKRGRGFAMSYKPSVLANEDRIITAIALDATSETAVIPEMLEQHMRTTGSQIEELLLDAGYFPDEVIATTLERNISLLCPSGKHPEQPKKNGKFTKQQFKYDDEADVYRCPNNRRLIRHYAVKETEKSREQIVYISESCESCPIKVQCTDAQTRRIRRYPEDIARNVLSQVMSHLIAKRIFSQRKAMVEPVFSMLRGQQKFNRFKRYGLDAVKCEFALQAMAYNLSRAVAM